MARPLPMHAQLEAELLQYRIEERQAKADGVIDAEEQKRLSARQGRINALAGRLVKTMRFVATCITGERGMDSAKAVEVWDQRQADRLAEEWTVVETAA